MFRFLLIAMLLLVAGCDYFDDSDDDFNLAKDSTPVILPADATWELIATLQRNPLAPAMFYIFPEENTAMINAYVDGKHFIFEFGGEYREDTSLIRHYIIQPEKPFQHKDKSPATIHEEKRSGVKWDVHEYFFRSEGWYVSVEFTGGYGTVPGAIGFGVEFSKVDHEARGHWTGGTDYNTVIGLADKPFSVGSGHSYISDHTRLRIYVSRD